MTAAERLLAYVIQGIQDEEGAPNRTRVLKIIYLIDIDYFRRHRRTLTGWKWVYYHFGPFAFEYPKTLDKMGVFLIDETEGETDNGKRFFRYSVAEHQQIYDLITPADQAMIDDTISRWSLEDLNLLLSHVYFHTEPMIGSNPGETLDFSKITVDAPDWQADPKTITITRDAREHFRERLAEARRQSEARRLRTSEHLHTHPIRADALYCAAMEALHKEENHTIPDGIEIHVKQEQSDSE